MYQEVWHQLASDQQLVMLRKDSLTWLSLLVVSYGLFFESYAARGMLCLDDMVELEFE
jgi:hypothetical protein